MSLGLLAPLGLAALAALLLPLLVHLARREEQVPTDFAALRWLAAKFRPRQRLRFEEIMLLGVRLLLLAALALLLAQPVLFGGRGDAPWLLVLPGADTGAAPTLPEGAQRRWLAPGFPELDSPMPIGPVAVGSLLRQIDAELPAATSLSVVVTSRFYGADGARPQLSRAVEWRVAGEAVDAAAPSKAKPFVLSIRHADERESSLPYLRAATLAMNAGDEAAQAVALDVAATGAALPGTERPLAWLAAGDLPEPVQAWIRAGGTALIDFDATWPIDEPGVPTGRDDGSEPLARAATLGSGRVLQFTRALTPAALPALLQPDFPQRLRTLVEPAPAAPTRADAAAYAPLTGGASFPETPRDLSPWLLWLVVALFAVERWLASGRRGVPA